MNTSLVYKSLILMAILSGMLAQNAHAERISDIRSTKHNFSVTSTNTTKATEEDQVCVFCHTPHHAENVPMAPLWNKVLSGATYTPYTSASIDANDIAATPGGGSKLCLSCHDGTLAIGAVNVLEGSSDVTIPMQGTGPGGVMPGGSGETTGFTRNLGVDLTNDHPISFTFDSALASADGELRNPAVESHIADRAPGVNPSVPLELGKVQCASCHDPHIRDSDPTRVIKFLRLNRLQAGAPTGGSFNGATDIICLGCHDKKGQAWSGSAHASPVDADETYTTTAASESEFPAGTQVWQAACLNCHDTHTVQGARRLLREGTSSLLVPKSGGTSAIEETCYRCHSGSGNVLIGQGGGSFPVPDIKTDFTTGLTHMPITTADQAQSEEVHNILDGDFSESTSLLNSSNRHVECTDCHNPHRVMKNRLFNGTDTNVAATHPHGFGHTNIASGALRGTFGVEPVYDNNQFEPTNLPLTYNVKKGDGGTGAGSTVNSPYVTREYQICLKCHSDFAFGLSPPFLGDTNGGTSSGTNNLTRYTNQAMEFQAPFSHKGETSTSDSGAGSGYQTNNHRSWHPVIDSTGRTAGTRNMTSSTNMFRSPWDGVNIGNQTMYCSDCHGSNTATDTVVPSGGEDGNPWGPHGSTNNFILKGTWDSNTGANSSGLCFRCHNHTNYATDQNEGGDSCCSSGFGGEKDSNLHAFHAKRVNKNLRCSWCHVAVPHGWKNKALLVNLNDVGPEAGLPAGTEVPIGSSGQTYNVGPYYNNAKLKIRNFRSSGTWRDSDCGSASGNPEVGREWMKTVCDNPP